MTIKSSIPSQPILRYNNLKTPVAPNWCPGCGDFGIWTAFKMACQEKGWNNTNTVISAGIGCHGHIVNFVRINAFEGLHGRALPIATGIKMANKKLNVIVFSGDGDCLAEGGNHFIHSCRRNHNVTLMLHDNAVYGLTTGQTSPASPRGFKSKSTPDGSFEDPLHPTMLAITAGATFVARAYASNIEHLKNIMVEATEHNGFSVVDILQPCVTFNKEYTANFYNENIYYLDKDHDPSNKLAALAKSMEWGAKSIPVGVIYKAKDSLSYEDQVKHITDKTLIQQGPTKRDITSLLEMNI